MRMLINEIRKSFLLAKKECLFVILFDIVAIPLLSLQMKETGLMGTYVIFFTAIFVTDMVIKNSISMAESKYERATSYLCATPYNRKDMVIGKYAFDFVIFGLYSIIYAVESMILDIVKPIPVWLALLFFLVLCIYQGVIIPLEFWIGYSRTKYVSTMSVMVVPFILPAILKIFNFSNMDFSFFANLRTEVVGIAIVAAMCLVVVVSGSISIRIFKAKSL